MTSAQPTSRDRRLPIVFEIVFEVRPWADLVSNRRPDFDIRPWADLTVRFRDGASVEVVNCMATIHRYAPAGLSSHVIVRGHNKMDVFGSDDERDFFLLFLQHAASCAAVAVHAFAVMTTHAHVIVTPSSDDGIARMMHRLGSRYGRYFNVKHARVGAVWASRYRAHVIDTDRYFLACLRYVERNPTEAGLVDHAEDYRWCSYSAHAFGLWPQWLTPHPLYLALAATDAEREASYRALCSERISDEEIAWIQYLADAVWPRGTFVLPRGAKPYTVDTSD